MLKYCGLALCALIAILILRSQKSEFVGFVGIAAAIIMLGAALTEFIPAISFVFDTIKDSPYEPYMSVLMKAFSITLAVQFTAEICRDAGESALATKLELVGKAQILLLCVPLIEELKAMIDAIVKG